MPFFSVRLRNIIVQMHKHGKGYKKIKKDLNLTEGIKISLSAVRKICKKFNHFGNVKDRKKSKKSKFGDDDLHKDYINKTLSDHPDTSAKTMKDEIYDVFGIRVSTSTVARARRNLGWVQKGTRYCQMIRTENKGKRLEWCQRRIEENETFDDVIFTDESRIELRDVARKSFRKVGQPLVRRKKGKHPYSLLVWAGISRRGATQILLFNGIMNSIWYQEEILKTQFLPFVNFVYPDGHRLYQDNDPKHVSKSTKAFMENQGINWWASPAESPDINPIENLWKEMKDLCAKERPKGKDDLVAAVLKFWETVTPEKCNRYIDHVKKVLPVVVEKGGDVTGF